MRDEVDELVAWQHAGARFALAAASSDGAVEVVGNADASGGISTSVRAGIAWLTTDGPHDVSEVVVLLGDQPGIDGQVVADLVAASRERDGAVGARYEDGPGHPVVLPRASWPLLLERLAGDTGVRSVADAIGLHDVVIPGAAPRDVDRPSDLAQLRRLASRD